VNFQGIKLSDICIQEFNLIYTKERSSKNAKMYPKYYLKRIDIFGGLMGVLGK
jgi:hypothetical protein